MIAGGVAFVERIKQKIQKNSVKLKFLALKENNTVRDNDAHFYVGKLEQLPDLVAIYNVNEVVFSAKEITYKNIINEMDLCKNKYVDYKIALNAEFVIGGKTIEKI